MSSDDDDRAVAARATIDGKILTDADIRDLELARARHALAYLKNKIGNTAMREMLEDDLTESLAAVRRWLDSSDGAWQTASVLTVPGPSAAAFHRWYVDAIRDNACEAALRAGHPEHFVSHPRLDGIEVIENVGESGLPWRVVYSALPDGEAFPAPWDPVYPVHFGAQLVMGGRRAGYSMHQLRDVGSALEMRLSTFLPSAVPRQLVTRHLHHFTIEFSNWSLEARRLTDSSDRSGTELPP